MPVLAIRNLKKSYVVRTLFNDISFEIESNEHVGFVGNNGTGKTTLFKIILGEEQYDEGNIYISSGVRIGCMRQGTIDERTTLYDYTLGVFNELLYAECELEKINSQLLCSSSEADTSALIERQHVLQERYTSGGGATFRARTRSTLLGLGFCDEDLHRDLATFSGGQHNKAQLARLLLSDANLLLLDEPTNHLDINSIEWLEGFLGDYQGAFIVISHDRYFLDKVTEKTIELKNQQLYVSNGNFSKHVELRSTARELERRRFIQTNRQIRRIQGIIEQQRLWGQEHNYVTAASKQKQVDKLKLTLVEPEKDSASIRFHFQPRFAGGNDVLVAKGLSKSFDGNEVFKNIDLFIKKGERVFLLGDNGCGKTTLLNVLMGRISQTQGSFYFGSHIDAAYYEQKMTSFDPSKTVLEAVWDDYYATLSYKEICNALAAFLFRGDDINKKIEQLSGGELARVQLLKLMLTRANLLLLDEPTNHLDIDSRTALENELEEYSGTMLVVTHDRYIVNKMADRVLYMTANGIEEYIGGYDDYLEDKKTRATAYSKADRQISVAAKEYRERKEKQSILGKMRSEVARVEASITASEAQLEEIDAMLSNSEIAADYMRLSEHLSHRTQVQTKLADLVNKWEALSESLNMLSSEDE